MKRRSTFKFLAAAAALGTLVTVGAARAATEGTDYVVLDKPIPNAQGTLIKVFSYDCPFCYKYDKTVTPQVIGKLPKSIAFRPFHLKTKGKYGLQASELFATLMLRDLAAGTGINADGSQFKKAKMAYYAAYHDKKERWDAGGEAFLKTGLDAAGLSTADLAAAKVRPEAQKLLAEWEASYEVAKIQGVPAFVVNGKYLILTKSIQSIDSMVETIVELSKK
jgi:thiol:disulfide interchange protein DsbA